MNKSAATIGGLKDEMIGFNPGSRVLESSLQIVSLDTFNMDRIPRQCRTFPTWISQPAKVVPHLRAKSTPFFVEYLGLASKWIRYRNVSHPNVMQGLKMLKCYC